MYEDVIIAGFGGQGVMLMGQLLCYAGLLEEKNVLWMPAYGPETRGGFANCTVIFSDEEIGSPMVDSPHSLIIMNLPSLDKFEDRLKKNGLLIVNSSLVDREVKRKDCSVVLIPATEMAANLGSVWAANMVALGAYVSATGVVEFESLFASLPKIFPGKEYLLPLNRQAIEAGAERARRGLPSKTSSLTTEVQRLKRE